MKVKVDDLIRYMILLASSVSMGLLYLFMPKSSMPMVAVRSFVLLLGILSYVLVYSTHKAKNRKKTKFAKQYTWMTIAIVSLFVIYTAIIYNYSLYIAYQEAIGYYYIIFSVPVAYLMSDEKQSNRLIKQVSIIVVLFLVLRTISWISINYSNGSLFPYFATEYEGWVRAGTQRYIYGSVFGVGFVFICSSFATGRRNVKNVNVRINRRKSIYYLVCLAFILLYSIFVTQLRFNTAAIIITIIFTLYATQEKNISKISFGLLIVLSFIGLVLSGLLDSFLDTFREGGLYGGSTIVRIEALNHFIQYFKTTGHYIGLGFPVNKLGTEYLFYRNAWKPYFIDDLGIFDPVVRFGIFFIPLFIYPFKKGIDCIRGSVKGKEHIRKIEKLSILVPTVMYMILSSFSSSMYVMNSAMSVPFFIAIISLYACE